MSYTPYGPFVNGNSPPISAEFFNAVEAYLQLVNSAATDANITGDGNGLLTMIKAAINCGSTILNGATAGTATLYQPFTGTLKLVIVLQNGFRNGGGTAQTLAIPTGFTTGFRFWNGDSNPLQFKSSSTARTVNLITALNAAGGTITSQTDVNASTIGDCFNSVDTISFNSGAAAAHTGVLVLVGI